MSEEWLGKYKDLCFHRGLPFDPWPSRLALLAAYGKDLIAGVMVYDSTGPFLHFQHLVTNETAPLRMRWAAVDLMASQILDMCRVMNKLPMVLVSHKGIARILRRHGLQDSKATNFSCHYSQLEKHDYKARDHEGKTIPGTLIAASQSPGSRAHPASPGAAYDRIEEDGPALHPPEH